MLQFCRPKVCRPNVRSIHRSTKLSEISNHPSSVKFHCARQLQTVRRQPCTDRAGCRPCTECTRHSSGLVQLPDQPTEYTCTCRRHTARRASGVHAAHGRPTASVVDFGEHCHWPQCQYRELALAVAYIVARTTLVAVRVQRNSVARGWGWLEARIREAGTIFF